MNPSTEEQRCIVDCQECHEVCLRTVCHLLDRGETQAEAPRVRLLLDCAQICQVSADFLIRGSELDALLCQLCATVCERCAEGCTQLHDGERIAQCAEVCRQCARSCSRLAQAAGLS